jgi:hypothetical protein
VTFSNSRLVTFCDGGALPSFATMPISCVRATGRSSDAPIAAQYEGVSDANGWPSAPRLANLRERLQLNHALDATVLRRVVAGFEAQWNGYGFFA